MLLTLKALVRKYFFPTFVLNYIVEKSLIFFFKKFAAAKFKTTYERNIAGFAMLKVTFDEKKSILAT